MATVLLLLLVVVFDKKLRIGIFSMYKVINMRFRYINSLCEYGLMSYLELCHKNLILFSTLNPDIPINSAG
jgi:hypothetical protein